MKLNIIPLSQRDSRWRSLKMPGGGTLGDYGCLVTCIAMSFGKTPLDLVSQDIFNGNYVDWTKLTKLFPYTFEKVEGKTQDTYKTKIKDRLDKGIPTIFEVDFDSGIAGVQQHFVLAIGYDNDLLLNDPWTGETYWLGGSYRNIISLRVLTPTSPALDPLAECLKTHGDLMNQLTEQGKELAEVQKKLTIAENDRNNLRESEKNLLAKIGELEEEGDNWQKEIVHLNENIAKLEEEKDVATKEKAAYKRYYEAALEKAIDKASVKDLLLELLKRITNGGK